MHIRKTNLCFRWGDQETTNFGRIEIKFTWK